MRSVWFWARATIVGLIAGAVLVMTGTQLGAVSAGPADSAVERSAVELLAEMRQRAAEGDDHAAALVNDLDT